MKTFYALVAVAVSAATLEDEVAMLKSEMLAQKERSGRRRGAKRCSVPTQERGEVMGRFLKPIFLLVSRLFFVRLLARKPKRSSRKATDALLFAGSKSNKP